MKVAPRVNWAKCRRMRELRAAVFIHDGFRCVYCGWQPRVIPGSDYDGADAPYDLLDRCLQVDHIVPRSKGGTNERDNLQTMCSECNRYKGATYTGPQLALPV